MHRVIVYIILCRMLYLWEFVSFQNQIRAHQEMLTDLLGSNTVKTITLKGVREGIQQLQQCLSIQQKHNVNMCIQQSLFHNNLFIIL